MAPINVGGVNTLEILLRGVAAEPRAEHRWLVLANWLEENGDPE